MRKVLPSTDTVMNTGSDRQAQCDGVIIKKQYFAKFKVKDN